MGKRTGNPRTLQRDENNISKHSPMLGRSVSSIGSSPVNKLSWRLRCCKADIVPISVGNPPVNALDSKKHTSDSMLDKSYQQ